MKEIIISQLAQSGHSCGLVVSFLDGVAPIVNLVDWSSSMGDPSDPDFPLCVPEMADPEGVTFRGVPFNDIRKFFPSWNISVDEYGDVSEEGLESFDCRDETALIFGIRGGERVSDTPYDEYGYSGTAWYSDVFPHDVIVTLDAWAN